MVRSFLCLRVVCIAFLAAGQLGVPRRAVADPTGPSFAADIKPLLSNRCLRCHGPDESSRQGGGDGGLRLDTFAGATADLGGHAAIVPGDPDSSVLIARITSTDPDTVMPPPDGGERLSPAQIEAFRAWVAGGAKVERHWSYVPPVRPEVLVIAAYQLRPKDRATSLDSAETYAASLRSALLASGWLSTTGAIVTFVGSDIAAGPDGWLWLTGKYLVSLTVDLS